MLLIIVLFILSLVAPLLYFYSGARIKFLPRFFQKASGELGQSPKVLKSRGKRALVLNILSFTAVFLLATVLVFSGRVYADGAASEAGELALAAAFIGAGLVTGLGAIGTGIAVSSAAAAAIGAISENENNFGKAMIFVAMAEGIAIYGLLISFMILGRV
jgi:V/A-type H+-transporting ATPase subunit K